MAIRYPNGCENQEVINAFYSETVNRPLSAARDFGKTDNIDAVIITHGRIVLEAMKAKAELVKKGISVGIILLEKIKPYGECAESVKNLIPEGVKSVLFLEEEIRSGGMGMNLSDVMVRKGILEGIKYSIIAVDDSFVEKREVGQHIYSAAGIDSDAVEQEISEML